MSIASPTHQLSEERIEAYQRDGFLRVRRFFEAEELEPLRRAYREDPSVNGELYGMLDSDGAAQPICIWTDLGEDIIGIIPRMARMVEATEALLGEPAYHWHSKLTVKPPGCGARVDWHQDFASWYDDGVLFPQMLTVGIAVEPASKANGCIQIIPGSHRMGRIDHRPDEKGQYKESFEIRVETAKAVLGLVHCELDVGDALFFDCNTLHGSGSNEADVARPIILVSYNAKSNEPVRGAQGPNEEGAFMNISAAERAYRPLEKLPDDVLSKGGYKSAFHHTRFSRPRLELGTDFAQAVRDLG